MSSEAQPISAECFAKSVRDLTPSDLLLKTLELRNSIAHLDYSNEQLRPFAEGREQAITPVNASISKTQPTNSTPAGEPDQVFIDSIKENEAVIARMEERIRIIKAEMGVRGIPWESLQGQNPERLIEDIQGTRRNEAERSATKSDHWTDGTFQTGIVRNGVIIVNPSISQPAASDSPRQATDQQIPSSDGQGEDGIHL